MKKIWLIGALMIVYGAWSIETAEPRELCCAVGSCKNAGDTQRAEWMRGTPDGGMDRRERVAICCNQRISGVQGFSTEGSNAELGHSCADHPPELYYDDTWEGYRGAWVVDCRAAKWTVALTLMSSVFVAAAGYWLFGIGYAKRFKD